MRRTILLLPEAFILLLSLYWCVENYWFSNQVNYFAISIFCLVLLQIFFVNKIMSAILGSVLFFIGLYFSLAVISEFRDFKIVSSQALRLLGFGLAISFVTLSSSVAFFYKSILRPF